MAQAAAAAGLSDRIDYRVVDLDQVELPQANYDGTFAMSSAHHVSNLENLFDQCREALKPGALNPSFEKGL
jgi:cyclopropane fatty-acyl-phospholipid synthase-like methyltransferase